MHAATGTKPDPSANDAELARLIGEGNHDAFVLMMRRHNRMLFRAARSILRDDAEAEDALQEGYLQAFRSIGKYRGDAKLSTWLTRIVVNEAIARGRKQRRHAGVTPLYPGDEPEAQVAADGAAGSDIDSPERGAMRAQTRLLLEQSLDALPEVFRTVFILRAVEEMSGEEVAACLDIPEATVRSRFFRARAMLRASLASQFDLAIEDAFSIDGARCDRVVAAVLARLDAAS
jgi:RNA polymerase sigma-70 factor (ECF subfamily)